MKVRTKRAARKLDKLIQEELGIDIKKYRDAEVEETVSDLLNFVDYAINAVKIPLFIGLILFIVGFFVLDLVHVENLIYGIFGGILMLITAVLIGILLVIWGIKNDVLSVIDYSLNLTKNIQQDTQIVQSQISDEDREHKYELFYKGVLHLVTIPIVSETIADKIPFVGGIFGRLIRRVLAVVTDNKLIFKMLLKSNVFESGGSETKAMQGFVSTTSRLRDVVEGIDNSVSKVLRVLQFPFVLALLIAGLMLAGLIWIVN